MCKKPLGWALAYLTPQTADQVTELAKAPDLVRGYEDIKLRSVEAFRARVAAILAGLEVSRP